MMEDEFYTVYGNRDGEEYYNKLNETDKEHIWASWYALNQVAPVALACALEEIINGIKSDTFRKICEEYAEIIQKIFEENADNEYAEICTNVIDSAVYMADE